MVTLKYKHKKHKLKYEVGDLPVGIKKLKYVKTRNKIQKKVLNLMHQNNWFSSKYFHSFLTCPTSFMFKV